MDKSVASQTWDALANAIDEIYNRNASQLSFEELYRNAYNLVLHKYGTLLYEGVTDKLNEHLSETAKRLAEVPNSKLLEEISTTWAEHQVSLSTLERQNIVSRTRPSYFHFIFAAEQDYHDHGS
jgi:cullin 3